MSDKQHAKEVEAAFDAWRLGVLSSKNIHACLSDVIFAVDKCRQKESVKDRDEANS